MMIGGATAAYYLTSSGQRSILILMMIPRNTDSTDQYIQRLSVLLVVSFHYETTPSNCGRILASSTFLTRTMVTLKESPI